MIRSSAVNGSPTMAISKIRQSAQLSPARTVPKRSGSDRAALMLTSGFMPARPWHGAPQRPQG
jgi:hypothetical protein